MTLTFASTTRRAALGACCSCSANANASDPLARSAGAAAASSTARGGPPSAASSSSRRTPARAAFSTSAASHAKPRKARVAADAPMNIRKLPAFKYDDIPTLGHEILEYNREWLRMFRLVELELPKLGEFREPFDAPEGILKIRYVHHQGGVHMENRKAVLTVDVGPLFAHSSGLLASDAAKHKFLLLAGEHYDRTAGLKDARDRLRVQKGLSGAPAQAATAQGEQQGLAGDQLYLRGANLTDEEEAALRRDWLGQVKIASDRFPNERMNASWCLDTFQKLIQEANNEPEAMSAIPLDSRPQLAKDAKATTFARSHPLSIRDFPKEWL